MTEPYYERLTQLDNSFLVYEDTLPTATMHVASTQVHDAAPLRAANGSIDIERIEEYVASRLDRIPRYRQVLAHTPIEGHPVWVDDENFAIHYHVRHTRLPRPGTMRQLKRLVGRVFSTRLDREKPLWELWVVEGLEGDRLATISKVHHCMVDGVSGAELIAALLTEEPIEKPEPARIWQARPRPSAFELGAGEVARFTRAPFDAAAGLLRIAADEDGARKDARNRLSGLGRMLGDMSGATPVPFNQPIGPHRRIDWMPMSIAQIKDIRKAFGGTLNDVVLATAAGGFGRFLSSERGVDLRDVNFRVMAPVNMRKPGEDRSPGNRVATWTIELPIDEPDPVDRLMQIHEQTEELKSSNAAEGAEVLTQVTEWTGTGVLSLGLRLMNEATPVNSVITNVPGPRVPLYLLNAPLREIHPHVPLMGSVSIGIALFSYEGNLSWGFSADWDLMPDLHDLVDATQRSFEELLQVAAQQQP
ncbi:MAG: wax ester/triacylglycerol synthase family O-acyltransferase [bacterium]|nr:wax ester/triacylglycerol synthase family O-acyltransferase [bacterium]